MVAYAERGWRWLWKWRWALLLNLYLLSPVLVYALRVSEPGDKATYFALVSSVLWLSAVQLLARRLWITHAVLFPLHLLAGVDLYVVTNYRMRLASTMLLTIVENFADAWGFLLGDFKRVATTLVLVLAFYATALWKIRGLRVTLPRLTALAPALGLAVVYVGALRYFQWFMPSLLLNDRNSPFGVLSQAYLAHSIHEQELIRREEARKFSFGATRAVPPEEPETYVLVVGESARKHNFSLYGYPRDTNPELSKIDNLIVFKDVITQVARTAVSVPLILTRRTIDAPERRSAEKSILAVFDEVGFRTHWLSTQQRETAMASITRYVSEADEARFFERTYDIALVDTMKEMSGRPNGAQKRFFLLHTLGSHFNLTSRYPREFAKFPDGFTLGVGGLSAFASHAELIGAYDNTIRYTDHVLASTIHVLEGLPGMKAMVYIPDHGDNLRDDERNMFGHDHMNEYDMPIPMLVWVSPEYAQHYPEKVAAARANVARRLNTRNVFYSMADLAGIDVQDPELARMSVFSPLLANFTRWAFCEPRPFDFDEWMARTGTKIPSVSPPL